MKKTLFLIMVGMIGVSHAAAVQWKMPVAECDAINSIWSETGDEHIMEVPIDELRIVPFMGDIQGVRRFHYIVNGHVHRFEGKPGDDFLQSSDVDDNGIVGMRTFWNVNHSGLSRFYYDPIGVLTYVDNGAEASDTPALQDEWDGRLLTLAEQQEIAAWTSVA